MYRLSKTILRLLILQFAVNSTLSADEPSWCRRTWTWLTSCCSKEKQDIYKRECRDCVDNWFADSPRPEYGMNVLDDLQKQTKLILFVHGLNSRPEDMHELIADAQASKLACATFRFANDQPLEQSTHDLSSELNKFHLQNPNIQISIVAHSMGGLVSRNLLESTGNGAWFVDQLVMLTPPNHGSRLAKYACSLDLWEYATSKRRRDEANIIVGSFADGLSEATDDLKPGSTFLRRLNACSRNSNVRYTIVIGTKGVVSAKKAKSAEVVLRIASKPDSWVAKTTKRIGTKAESYNELLDGAGDGVVSVQSAKLSGVDDVIYGRFSHGEILASEPSSEVREVRKEIIKRLVADR